MLDQNTKRLMKKIGKEIISKQSNDCLKLGISDKTRVIQTIHDTEGYTEYGIYNADGMTDSEIKVIIAYMRKPKCDCQYDCCGHAFTRYIDFKRLKNDMISIIHSVGYNL